jgi:signal transduction histidine kinase
MEEHWERLFAELRAEFILRERELETLHEIDMLLLQPEQSPSRIFPFIVDRIQQLLGASHGTILLRRSTFLEPMYSSLQSVIGQRVPIRESLTGLSLETNRLVNISDLLVDPHKTRYMPPRGYSGPQMRSLLAIPIVIRGTSVAVLNVESTSEDAFKPVHERIATAIAAQVAIALQRTQTLASEILFSDIDRLMFATEDSQHEAQHVIQTALERVMAELKRLEHVHHTGAQIMFLRGQNELEIVHSTNPRDIGLILQTDRSVSGRAARECKTVIVGDVAVDPDYQRMLSDSIRSEIAVPILFGDDDLVIGVLNVESDEEDAFYGFYQVVLESFAEKVKTLLAFAKLRADVTEALELRSADDLLVAVGDQTSHILHRVNNTVGAMRFNIMQLQDQQDKGQLHEDRLREVLASLHNLADRTLKMPEEITRLLTDVATVDVNDCVRKAVNQIEMPEDIELDLRLSADIPPQPLYCFDIVVQNLVQNGIDAMPKGGQLSIRTSVVLDAQLSAGYLLLSVHDSGAGIPVEIQSRIFDLNFSTKSKRGNGLGFGLWWVRAFVRRSRGDISVESSPGAGTEMNVKIPLTRQPEPAQAVNIH